MSFQKSFQKHRRIIFVALGILILSTVLLFIGTRSYSIYGQITLNDPNSDMRIVMPTKYLVENNALIPADVDSFYITPNYSGGTTVGLDEFKVTLESDNTGAVSVLFHNTVGLPPNTGGARYITIYISSAPIEDVWGKYNVNFYMKNTDGLEWTPVVSFFFGSATGETNPDLETTTTAPTTTTIPETTTATGDKTITAPFEVSGFEILFTLIIPLLLVKKRIKDDYNKK